MSFAATRRYSSQNSDPGGSPDLDTFNEHVVGRIEVVPEFHGSPDGGSVAVPVDQVTLTEGG